MHIGENNGQISKQHFLIHAIRLEIQESCYPMAAMGDPSKKDQTNIGFILLFKGTFLQCPQLSNLKFLVSHYWYVGCGLNLICGL